MSVFIYGLHGDDGVIRYVGKTRDLQDRLLTHLYYARKGYKSRKDNWIRKVLRGGGTIQIRLIEEVQEGSWKERETHWIATFENLTNSTSGGDGLHDPSPLARKNMAEAQRRKTLSETHKQAISRANKGRKFSDQHRANLATKAQGRTPSFATRYKMSIAASRRAHVPRKLYTLLGPDGTTHTVHKLTGFCKDHGLSISGIMKPNRVHRGYRLLKSETL